jgi:hypothetical protein
MILYRFLHEASYIVSYRFLREATGGYKTPDEAYYGKVEDINYGR